MPALQRQGEGLMDSGQVLGRGISFPPRLGADGRWAWSSGEQNIRESIRVILLTEFRERMMLPEFGGNLQQHLFMPNTVATRHTIGDRVEKALSAWEPRVRVEEVQVEALPDDPEAALVTIVYRLIATQVRERMNMTVTFAA
jgi:phage baseplate assembly protein W